PMGPRLPTGRLPRGPRLPTKLKKRMMQPRVSQLGFSQERVEDAGLSTTLRTDENIKRKVIDLSSSPTNPPNNERLQRNGSEPPTSATRSAIFPNSRFATFLNSRTATFLKSESRNECSFPISSPQLYRSQSPEHLPLAATSTVNR